jgi:hypothetical protein
MILPKAFLDSLAFYEHKVVEHKAFSSGFTSVFTLHFKSAWKWPKKIKMPWTLAELTGDLANYKEPNGSSMLRQQLQNYFKEPAL